MSSQLADGLIDGFAFAAGLPIAAFSELEAQHEVRFVTFSDEERKKLMDKYPSLAPSTIPADTRSDERRDGKECYISCRSRWSTVPSKTKNTYRTHKSH